MSERGGHVPHISDNMDDILFLSVEVTNTDSAAAIRKKKNPNFKVKYILKLYVHIWL